MASNSQCDKLCCKQTNAHGHWDGTQCVCAGGTCGGKVSKTRDEWEFSVGGYLVGPTHEDGGISGIVDGVEPIEVEGGEFIINAETVAAVGEEFLHELNSTQTQYHQGGFEAGQLPSPSVYDRGGKVKKAKYPRGGVATAGGRCIKHKMPDGSIMRGPVHGPGQICVQWSTTPPSIENFHPGGDCETNCPSDEPCYECCSTTQGCGVCCGANCCESVERAGGKVSRKGGKTLGPCSAEQLKRKCKNVSMGVGLECRCPKVEKPSPNRSGGKVSGIQRFKSGGRVGTSRLGHPIKKG